MLAIALLTIVGGVIATGIKINNSPAVYLPQTAESVVLDKQLRQVFPQNDVLIFLFQSETSFTPEFLRLLAQTGKAIEKLANVERVISVTTLEHIGATDEGFSVEPLVDVNQAQQKSEEEIISRVMTDRFAPGMIAGKEGKTLALIIRPKAIESSMERQALEDQALAIAQEQGVRQHIVAVAGEIALDVAQLRSTMRDNLIFIPLTMIGGLLLIWWLFRRVLAVVVTLVAISCVVNFAMALFVIFDQPYTLVASMTPPLMTTLTIALLIHFFNSLAYMSKRGFSGEERVKKALREIHTPALYTVLTTAAGFLSLTVTTIKPIQVFGVVACIAILFMYCVVVYLLPAIVVYFDRRAWPAEQKSAHFVNVMVKFATKLAVRRAGWVVGGSLGVLLLGAPFIYQIQAETNLYRFFADDHPLIQSTKQIESHLSGVMPLELSFKGAERDALIDPQVLAKLNELQDWLAAQPEVDRVTSVVDIIEEMHWAFNGEQAEFRRVPENQRLIAQYLLVYDGRDLYDFIDREYQQTRMLLNLNVHGASAIKQVIERIEQKLSATVDTQLAWHVGGTGRLFSDQVDLLVQGQVSSLWAVMAMITVLMWLLWRSLPAALLCMLPNIAPIVVIFIVMGFSRIDLDVATALIACIAMGIAVDDTIHIYGGYTQKLRRGAKPIWALVRTMHQAGRAVVATTVVLSAQFFLLTASQFQPTAHFGLLTGIGLIAALLFDLFLLPALLVLFRQRRFIRRM